MTVGVVIVTFNAAAHIGRCLETLAGQIERPHRVLVVDNGSSDRTTQIASDVSARLGLEVEIVALGANLGFTVANNRAVERLHDCEGVALLNPDAFPRPQWLAALVRAAAAHPEAASFASRLMIDGRDDVLDGAGDVLHVSGLAWRHGHRQPIAAVADALLPHAVFAACAAAALYRRADWQEVQGFDERYFCYHEDVDLAFRLQLLGRRCRYVPDAIADHVGSATTGHHSDFSVYYGYRNLEWTFVKNMPTRLLWRYLPVHMATTIAAFGFFLMKRRGWSLVRAKWDSLIGLRAVLGSRRAIQRRRKMAIDELDVMLDRTPLRSRFGAVWSRD